MSVETSFDPETGRSTIIIQFEANLHAHSLREAAEFAKGEVAKQVRQILEDSGAKEKIRSVITGMLDDVNFENDIIMRGLRSILQEDLKQGDTK